MNHQTTSDGRALILVACLVAGLMFPGRSLNAADPDPAKVVSDGKGFVPIFNGKDLKGWDGDPQFWSVHDGVLRGETTPEKAARHNTFLIWREQQPKDFFLTVKFRIQGEGNSGVQFRSRDLGDWEVAGYQAEVANDRSDPGIGAGFMHDERGPRGHLGHVGEFSLIDLGGKRSVIAKLADTKALLAVGYYRNEEWNEYTIAAQGNRIRTWVNGYQTLELIDNDSRKVAGGIIALQLHAGKPMLVEFKDIMLQTIDAQVNSGGRKFNDQGQSGWVTAPE